MNTKLKINIFFHLKATVSALLAGMILIPGLRAQPTEQTVQNRFLFVFDTSREMKARGAALEKALNTLLATSLNGQLHAGDSMGVWTFGQDLRPGDYPLQSWNPDNAVMIASNLVKYVGNQHYGKAARYEALQPLLNKVVQNSERLTVLIFCDGGEKFTGTPFDDGINQIFDQKRNDQKSAAQPFVILLRSQLGQYIGCSVGLPPQPLTYPQFPPLPLPPPPPPKVTNAPPPSAPVVSGQPLIIVGTNTESSPAPSKAVTTNPPAEIKSAPPEAPPNAAAPPPTNPVKTNLPAQIATPTNAAPSGTTQTSSPPADSDGKIFPIIAAGLVGAAIALGLVFWLRPRPKDSSLITRSMNDRK
jgi:hypothetical protein